MPSSNNNLTPIPISNGTVAALNNSAINTNNMDHWRVAVLGDGGVGKTALAVQVCHSHPIFLLLCSPFTQFTLNCFVGE